MIINVRILALLVSESCSGMLWMKRSRLAGHLLWLLNNYERFPKRSQAEPVPGGALTLFLPACTFICYAGSGVQAITGSLVQTDSTSGPRVSHGVSTSHGRHQCWSICQRKPVISGLNPQDLPSFCSHRFFLPLHHGVRCMPSFSSFFTLKIMFLPWLRSLPIFVCCYPAQNSERRLSSKRSPWRQGACPTPPFPHLHHHLDRHPLDFVNPAPHSPPNSGASWPSQIVHDTSPHPIHVCVCDYSMFMSRLNHIIRGVIKHITVCSSTVSFLCNFDWAD